MTFGESRRRTALKDTLHGVGRDAIPRSDGTVVPSAAGGSLMLTPDITMPVMRALYYRYGKRLYGQYGFADAFNPNTGWYDQEVLGIDLGITLLSAENLRTGNIWRWFMENPEPNRAMNSVGLVSTMHRVPGRIDRKP